MPALNSGTYFESLTIVYRRNQFHHVPVVVLTGFPDTEMAVTCLCEGTGGRTRTIGSDREVLRLVFFRNHGFLRNEQGSFLFAQKQAVAA